MKDRVFALEPCRHLQAETLSKYGELVYLFAADGERSSIWSDDFAKQVVEKLSLLRFDTVRDYYVVAGGNVANYVAGTAIISAFGEFRSLCFNPSTQLYQPVTLFPMVEHAR